MELYKTYNKAKKFFKKPKLKFYCGKNKSGLPLYFYKWLHISYHDVYWKDKFNEPRFEYAPELNIILFKKWQIRFYLENPLGEKGEDDDYWEYVLLFLYYNEDNNFFKEYEGRHLKKYLK